MPSQDRVLETRRKRKLVLEPAPPRQFAVDAYMPKSFTSKYVTDLNDSWGYGGTTPAKNAASPAMIDLATLGVPRTLWLPGTAGNYVSTPDVNEMDYDSSTFENGVGRWEGLNKNLLSANQSSLESNTSGWVNGANATLTRDTTKFQTGTASLKVTANSTNTIAVQTGGYVVPDGLTSFNVPVIPGQVYTILASTRAETTGRQTYLDYAYLDSAGTSLGYVAGAKGADNSSGWTQTSVTCQAPATAAYIRIVIGWIGCVVGEVHYVDAVGLFETPNGNLVVNPDFENGTTGWLTAALGGLNTGAVLTQDTSRSYTGRSSGKVVATASPVQQGIRHPVTLVVGQTYTASAWVYLESGTNVVISINDGVGSTVSSLLTTVGAWTRISVTRTVSGTAGQVEIRTSGAFAATFYVDAVQVVVGSAPVDYLPPTTHNLAPNPSLDIDGTGWLHSGANTTWTRETSGGFVGSAFGRAGKTDTSTTFLNAPRVTVREGETYTGSVYVRPSVTTSFSLFMRWDKGIVPALPTGNTTTGTSVSCPANVWTRLTATGVATPGADNILPFLVLSTAITVDVDAFQLEMGTVATPYVDGSLGAGYSWDSSENLLSNPSFDTNTSNWTADAATLTRDTAAGAAGTGSAKLESTHTHPELKQQVNVVPGTTYTASAFFKSPNARKASISIEHPEPWGYGGTGTAKNAASAPIIDLDYLEQRTHVYLSGAVGHYISTPDTPDLRVTGDLDLRVQVAMDDWTPSAESTLIGRWNAPGSSRSYDLRVRATTGRLVFYTTADGASGASIATAESTASVPFVDGQRGWVRATRASSTGAVTFYTSADGTTWTQLGAVVTSATGAIYAGISPLHIGAVADGGVPSKGKIFSAEVRSGINGPIVASFDARDGLTHGAPNLISGARVWTINGAGSQLRTAKVAWLPGTAGNYVSTPDVNEIDYDSSTFENGVGRWEGLNKNLLTANQSSIETDTTAGFIYGAGTVAARSTAQAFVGTASMSLTRTTTGDLVATTDMVAVVPGQVYTATAQLRAAATPREGYVRIIWYANLGDSGNLGVPAGVNVGIHSAGWTQATVTAHAPLGAKYARMGIVIPNLVVANEIHYVDAFGLFETPNGNVFPYDPSCERPWWLNKNNLALVENSPDAYIGRQSYRAVGTLAQYGFRTMAGMTVGTTYTLSAFVKGTGTLGFRAASGGSSGNVLGEMSHVLTSTWTRVSVTFTATTTDPWMILRANSSNLDVLIDAVQLVVGSAAVDYLPPTTTNLVRNPSVEVDLANWSTINAGAGATLVRSTARAYIGTASALLTYGTNPAAHGGGGVNVDVIAGVQYTFSVWVYGVDLQQNVSIITYSGANGTKQGPSATIVNGVWTRLTYTYTFANSASTLVFVGGFTTPHVAGTSLHMDAVQVEVGSIATPYIDGSLGAGYAWDASENLIANGSFETDTAGWEGLNKNLLSANQSSYETEADWIASTNVVLSQSTTVSLVGTKSLTMTSAAAGDMTAYGPAAPGTPVVAGQVYTFAASFRAAAPGRIVAVGVQWRTEVGSIIETYAAPVADHIAGWTQSVLVAQAPENATRALVRVKVIGTGATGEVHYVDAIGLFETSNGNLVHNPDFENGTGSWVAYKTGSTVVRSTEQAYHGVASCKVTTDGSNSAAGLQSAPVTVIPNSPYIVSARVYTATPTSLHLRLALSGVGVAVGGTVTTVAGWNYLTYSGDSLAAGNYTVDVITPTATAVTFYVDAVQLVAGSTPVEYVPPTTSNFVTNPTFEVNTTGWAAGTNTSIAREAAQGYVATSSLRLTALADANLNAYSLGGEVTPGQTLTVSAYYKAATVARDVQTGFLWLNPDGSALGTSSYGTVVTATTTGWTRSTHTLTAPAGAARVRIYVYVKNALTGEQFYVDAVQLEYGSVATPYVDGSLGAGYAWEASENLHPNPSGETGLSSVGTAGTGTTLTRDTTTGFDGSSSYQFACDGTIGAQGMFSTFAHSAPVTLTSSAYVKGTGTVYIATRIQYTDTNYTETQSAAYTLTGTWTRLIAPPVTSDPTRTTQYVTIQVRTSGAQAVTFNTDALQVEARSYATPYSSTGTAHASTSVRRTPWVLGGTSQEVLTSSAGTPTHGTKVLTGTINGLPVAPGFETRVAVAPSTTYTLSLNVTNGSQTVLGSTIRVLDAATNAVLITKQHDSGVMPKHTLTFITGSATTSVRVQVLRNGATRPGDSPPSIDAVQLEQRSYATPYAQAGTAHASTSTRRQPWVLGGTSIEILENIPWGGVIQGTKAMFVDGAGVRARGLWNHGLMNGVELRVSVAPSTTYTYSMANSINNGFAMRVIDNLGRKLGEFVHLGGSSGVATRSVTFTTLSDTTSVRLQRVTGAGIGGGNSGVGLDIYVDAVQLEKSSTATPYQLPTRITGDIDLRAHVALEDWTPAVTAYILTRFGDSMSDREYSLGVRDGGYLIAYCSDGITPYWVTSSVIVPATDGARLWVRVTHDVDNGAGGNDFRFYTSTDGVTWTQLGVTVTAAGVYKRALTSAYPLSVGANSLGNNPVKGKLISAEVRAGIDGTVVARYDADQHTADTFIDSRGRSWSITRAGDATAEIVDRNTWAFTGTEYLEFPDQNALDFGAGESFALAVGFNRRIHASANRVLAGKWVDAGGINDGYALTMGASTLVPAINIGDGTSGTNRSAAAAVAGSWGVAVGERLPNGFLQALMNTVSTGLSGIAVTGDTSNALSFRVGAYSTPNPYPITALISWVALFRRVLTTAEHAQLAAWNGTVATEPAWLRGAATLYINADDPVQRREYRLNNSIKNLAYIAEAKVTTSASGWTRAVTTGTIPSGQTSVSVVARFAGEAEQETHYVDALQFEQRNYPTPYGSTGVANQSTSTRRQPWVLGGTSLETLTTGGTPTAQGSSKMIVIPSGYANIRQGARLTVPVIGSTAYTLSSAIQGGQLAVDVVDSTGVLIYSANQGGGPIATTRSTITFTTSPGATYISIRIRSTITTFGPANAFWVDAVQLERGSTATTYTLPTRITGDLDVRAHLAPETWSDDTAGVVDVPAGFRILFRSNKRFDFQFYADDGIPYGPISSAGHTFVDGKPGWIRATITGTTIRFYTSNDGVAWTQLGTDMAATGPRRTLPGGSIRLGARDSGASDASSLKGKLLSAEVRAGINGVVVAKYDATRHTGATYADPHGKTWTITRSGDATAEIVDRNVWAFAAPDQMLITNRAELNFAAGEPFTLCVGLQTRSTTVHLRALEKRTSGSAGHYGLLADLANISDVVGDNTINTPGTTGSADYQYLSVGRLSDGTRFSRRGTDEVAGSIVSGPLTNVNSLKVVGSGNLSGLYKWFALFRRVLTSTEHSQLAAWDGAVATEPPWIRQAAVLYVNADDPQQRIRYRLHNRVINLATREA